MLEWYFPMFFCGHITRGAFKTASNDFGRTFSQKLRLLGGAVIFSSIDFKGYENLYDYLSDFFKTEIA